MLHQLYLYHGYTTYAYEDVMFIYSPDSRHLETIKCEGTDDRWKAEKAEERMKYYEAHKDVHES